MKRELRYKEGERLCDWCDRIADYYNIHALDMKTFRDILGEVSKWSYIIGSNIMMNAMSDRKEKRNEDGLLR